ncbi:MAG: hypothetical protein ACXV97_11730, partial [Chthoniobacterales bacterium]
MFGDSRRSGATSQDLLRTSRGFGVIARFRDFLPVTATTPVISLGEGNTPLIPSPKLAAKVGRGCEVFVK